MGCRLNEDIPRDIIFISFFCASPVQVSWSHATLSNNIIIIYAGRPCIQQPDMIPDMPGMIMIYPYHTTRGYIRIVPPSCTRYTLSSINLAPDTVYSMYLSSVHSLSSISGGDYAPFMLTDEFDDIRDFFAWRSTPKINMLQTAERRNMRSKNLS